MSNSKSFFKEKLQTDSYKLKIKTFLNGFSPFCLNQFKKKTFFFLHGISCKSFYNYLDIQAINGLEKKLTIKKKIVNTKWDKNHLNEKKLVYKNPLVTFSKKNQRVALNRIVLKTYLIT